MIKFGIDISKHNGDISTNLLANRGFVMIRTSYGWENQDKQKDLQVYNNVYKCHNLNIPFGFYHYSYATNESEAIKEAEFCLKIVREVEQEYGKPLMPIAYDIEDKVQINLNKEQLSKIACAFCNKIEQAGYYAIIYASRSWFLSKFDLNEIAKYDKWVADWTDKTNSSLYSLIPFGMRQYRVDKGLNLDFDISLKDYPYIIKKMYDNKNKVNKIKVGDKVIVKNPIHYDTGKKFKLYFKEYEVMEIYPKNSNRYIIGVNGVITAPINIENIERVN